MEKTLKEEVASHSKFLLPLEVLRLLTELLQSDSSSQGSDVSKIP